MKKILVHGENGVGIGKKGGCNKKKSLVKVPINCSHVL
jgi:hypothetical protein